MKDNTDLLLWKNSPPVLLTWLATLDLLNLKTLLPFLWHNLVIFFLVLHTWTWSERLVWFFLALFTPNPFISRGVLYNSLPENHLYRFLQYSIICSSSYWLLSQVPEWLMSQKPKYFCFPIAFQTKVPTLQSWQGPLPWQGYNSCLLSPFFSHHPIHNLYSSLPKPFPDPWTHTKCIPEIFTF